MIKLTDILNEIQDRDLSHDEESFIRTWVISKPMYQKATQNQKKKLVAIYSDFLRNEKDENPRVNVAKYFTDIDNEKDWIQLSDLASYKGYGYDEDDSNSPLNKMLRGDDEAEMNQHADRIAKTMNQHGAKDLNQLSTLKQFSLNEAKKEVKDTFEDFAETRGKGAAKIADNAHDKGGLALLTWHHFRVKEPYYKKAAEGKFDIEKGEEEYKELLEKLYKATSKGVNIPQIRFQELVGKIEVLGELLIKHK